MKIIAHIRELVVEGDAAFSASDFRRQLSERLGALCGEDECLGVETLALSELVVCTSTVRDAAQATALALVERMRRTMP